MGVNDTKMKTAPFFNEYDPVTTTNENPSVNLYNANKASSQGFMNQKPSYGSNGLGEMLDDEMGTNDACIDCVSYLRRISIGTHQSNQVHKLTSKSKPYYTHLLVEHYNDEETLFQVIDELLETKDADHNATELFLLLSNLVTKEEPPVLQTLIKVEKYLISKSNDFVIVPILKDVIDPLVTTFNHPHANVRKSVVF